MIERMATSRFVVLAPFALLAAAACRSGSDAGAPGAAPPADAPYVVVLGVAQDGGLPHIACWGPTCPNCRAARGDPGRRRLVTSLLLCDPRDGRRWLFDATPDLPEQLDRAQEHPRSRAERLKDAGARPPLLDGLFLTHAHMGHYGGLLQLGREAYAAKELPTWVTPRFAEFLTKNGPWSLMVSERRLLLHELVEGEKVDLAPDLFVVPFRVPHRDEFSDTVGFEIHGPARTLVYLPDIDKWEKWDAAEPAVAPGPGKPGRVESLIARCDVALLDGCFFADGEIAGRSMKEIPHPFVAESIERLAPLPSAERAKVWLTHLNHTNPAADPGSAAARAVAEAGMHVLDEGRVFGL
jgi:pyrroloquinoline quinone biosynthesis protein B